MWSTGGATEEDYYCIQDMGLSQQDVDGIAAGHAITMQGVMDAVVANNGFAWPLLSGREASLDLADPRPKCAATLRAHSAKAAGIRIKTRRCSMDSLERRFTMLFLCHFQSRMLQCLCSREVHTRTLGIAGWYAFTRLATLLEIR